MGGPTGAVKEGDSMADNVYLKQSPKLKVTEHDQKKREQIAADAIINQDAHYEWRATVVHNMDVLDYYQSIGLMPPSKVAYLKANYETALEVGYKVEKVMKQFLENPSVELFQQLAALVYEADLLTGAAETQANIAFKYYAELKTAEENVDRMFSQMFIDNMQFYGNDPKQKERFEQNKKRIAKMRKEARDEFIDLYFVGNEKLFEFGLTFDSSSPTLVSPGSAFEAKARTAASLLTSAASESMAMFWDHPDYAVRMFTRSSNKQETWDILVAAVQSSERQLLDVRLEKKEGGTVRVGDLKGVYGPGTDIPFAFSPTRKIMEAVEQHSSPPSEEDVRRLMEAHNKAVEESQQLIAREASLQKEGAGVYLLKMGGDALAMSFELTGIPVLQGIGAAWFAGRATNAFIEGQLEAPGSVFTAKNAEALLLASFAAMGFSQAYIGWLKNAPLKSKVPFEGEMANLSELSEGYAVAYTTQAYASIVAGTVMGMGAAQQLGDMINKDGPVTFNEVSMFAFNATFALLCFGAGTKMAFDAPLQKTKFGWDMLEAIKSDPVRFGEEAAKQAEKVLTREYGEVLLNPGRYPKSLVELAEQRSGGFSLDVPVKPMEVDLEKSRLQAEKKAAKAKDDPKSFDKFDKLEQKDNVLDFKAEADARATQKRQEREQTAKQANDRKKPALQRVVEEKPPREFKDDGVPETVEEPVPSNVVDFPSRRSPVGFGKKATETRTVTNPEESEALARDAIPKKQRQDVVEFKPTRNAQEPVRSRTPEEMKVIEDQRMMREIDIANAQGKKLTPDQWEFLRNLEAKPEAQRSAQEQMLLESTREAQSNVVSMEAGKQRVAAKKAEKVKEAVPAKQQKVKMRKTANGGEVPEVVAEDVRVLESLEQKFEFNNSNYTPQEAAVYQDINLRVMRGGRDSLSPREQAYYDKLRYRDQLLEIKRMDDRGIELTDQQLKLISDLYGKVTRGESLTPLESEVVFARQAAVRRATYGAGPQQPQPLNTGTPQSTTVRPKTTSGDNMYVRKPEREGSVGEKFKDTADGARRKMESAKNKLDSKKEDAVADRDTQKARELERVRKARQTAEENFEKILRGRKHKNKSDKSAEDAGEVSTEELIEDVGKKFEQLEDAIEKGDFQAANELLAGIKGDVNQIANRYPEFFWDKTLDQLKVAGRKIGKIALVVGVLGGVYGGYKGVSAVVSDDPYEDAAQLKDEFGGVRNYDDTSIVFKDGKKDDLENADDRNWKVESVRTVAIALNGLDEMLLFFDSEKLIEASGKGSIEDIVKNEDIPEFVKTAIKEIALEAADEDTKVASAEKAIKIFEAFEKLKKLGFDKDQIIEILGSDNAPQIMDDLGLFKDKAEFDRVRGALGEVIPDLDDQDLLLVVRLAVVFKKAESWDKVNSPLLLRTIYDENNDFNSTLQRFSTLTNDRAVFDSAIQSLNKPKSGQRVEQIAEKRVKDAEEAEKVKTHSKLPLDPKGYPVVKYKNLGYEVVKSSVDENNEELFDQAEVYSKLEVLADLLIAKEYGEKLKQKGFFKGKDLPVDRPANENIVRLYFRYLIENDLPLNDANIGEAEFTKWVKSK